MSGMWASVSAGRALYRFVFAVIGALLVSGAIVSSASAATIQVNTPADENGVNPSNCSLREAIQAANTNAAVSGCPAGDAGGTDQITFAAGTNGATFLVSSTWIVISSNVRITGNGPSQTRLDGQITTPQQTRIFQVDPGNPVTIEALTIQNGFNAGLGGGVVNNGTLTVTNVVFSGNRAANGGGISSAAGTTLLVSDSVFTNNSTTSVGGGGLILFSQATVRNSLIINNTAQINGGGVNVQGGGSLKLINSTLAGNTSGGLGGGISNLGSVDLIHSTLRDNAGTDGDGIASNTANVRFRGTIMANGGNSSNCSPVGALVTRGANVMDDNTCFAALQATDKVVGNVGLRPLANNGGPTQTYALDDGSLALNATGSTPCTEDGTGGGAPILRDQRGVERPASGSCDAGAFERRSGILQLTQATVGVSETAGTASFTVERISGSDEAVGVTVTLTNGTATAPDDYAGASQSVSFAAGDTTPKTVNIPIVDDALAESNETVTVALTNPTGGAILGPPATATLTIIDNETANIIATQTDGATAVTEGGRTDTFTVRLTSQPTANVTITMNAGSQLALAPANTLTFTPANWASAQTVTVSAVDDAAPEGPHSGTVTLTAASSDASFNNAVISGSPISVAITDNDVGVVRISGVSRAEGNAQTTPTAFTFPVTLSPPSVFTVTVQYATADGTARAGEDYTATSGTLTFAPGETSKNITVQVTSDVTVEPNETFRVILSNAVNGEIGTAQATATLENDDVDGTSAGDDSGRGTGKEKDTDAEKPPSQLQQQQQDRTNDSNLDQYHTEGNVASVERSEDGGTLLITIALGRGETLVIELRCSPEGCPDIRPGDYLSVEGEQGGREEGGRFIAEQIEIIRNGSRVR